MRLHTDGSTIVLLTPKARLTWRNSGKNAVEALPANTDVGDYDRSGLMCLTPSGERDYSARLNAAGAIAADAIDEENVGAIILVDDTTYLGRGPVQLDGQWPSIIDVGQVEPVRVNWPPGLIWKKGDTSLYEMADSHGNGIPGSFVPNIENNTYGTAICSVGSGTVVVVRPDSDAPDFSVQVPSQEEAALYALATAEGVLITIIIDGQDSAYIHIAEDGSVLGHRSAQSAAPALQLEDGFLLYDDSGTKLLLVDSTLNPITDIELPFPAIETASAVDGTSFALADAETILRGHLNANGELVVLDSYRYAGQVGQKPPGEIAATEAKWDPARYHGKTSVGFAAGVTHEPWTADSGKPFQLKIHARSTGGAGEGISVVIGGDATKHCEFQAVEVDGIKIDLTQDEKGQYTAELPTILLVIGLEYPFNPKPKNDAQKHAAALLLAETHLELTLFGSAHKISSDLMSVSISALGSDTPPLKWMRPLTIS